MTDTLRLRLSGVFILAAFPLFGVGQALLGGEFSQVGLFMALTNSIAVLAIGLLMRPIIAKTSPTTANVYLIARALEGALLALSTVAAFGGVLAVGADPAAYYQWGMIALGLGSLGMCWWLIGSQLVPPVLGRLGFLGYLCLVAGMIAGMNDAETLSMTLLMPGALFELIAGILFIMGGQRKKAAW